MVTPLRRSSSTGAAVDSSLVEMAPAGVTGFVKMPLCISGVLGRAQVFLVKGETPLLCGRPIIEALGIDLAFSRQAIRYRDGPWMPATLGLQGEYLLPLWEPNEELDFANLDFQFDLIVASEGEVDPKPCSLQQFEQEEHALVTDDKETLEPCHVDGLRNLLPKQLQTFDLFLHEMQNDLHGYVTGELHSHPKRVIWEVYEQPLHALSWKTRALRHLPGFFTMFDQCQYGSRCLDTDGLWKLVKKPTAILTTKRFLQ